MTKPSSVATVAGTGPVDSGSVSPLPQPDIPKSVQAIDYITAKDQEPVQRPTGTDTQA